MSNDLSWCRLCSAVAQAERSLDHLEQHISTLLSSALEQQPSMGQLAVAVVLGYLDLRFSDRQWRVGRPALAEWEARIRTRPSLVATAPPAL